jgi:hypothetical protein
MRHVVALVVAWLVWLGLLGVVWTSPVREIAALLAALATCVLLDVLGLFGPDSTTLDD